MDDRAQDRALGRPWDVAAIASEAEADRRHGEPSGRRHRHILHLLISVSNIVSVSEEGDCHRRKTRTNWPD